MDALAGLGVFFVGLGVFFAGVGVLWAITLWPVHLSRIGLRPLLIVPVLTLTFWLATKAYRQQNNWLWALAGVVYGLGFYTYLAFQFAPLLLLLPAGGLVGFALRR